jgi:hypothetical protein
MDTILGAGFVAFIGVTMIIASVQLLLDEFRDQKRPRQEQSPDEFLETYENLLQGSPDDTTPRKNANPHIGSERRIDWRTLRPALIVACGFAGLGGLAVWGSLSSLGWVQSPASLWPAAKPYAGWSLCVGIGLWSLIVGWNFTRQTIRAERERHPSISWFGMLPALVIPIAPLLFGLFLMWEAAKPVVHYVSKYAF